jgi:hypothetical protein
VKINVPKPHPQIRKLGYFVGQWTVEGAILPGPWGAGGTFSWTDTTKWMAGKFFVVGHWDFKMPRALGGNGEEIFVMGYDENQNAYTFDAFSSQGLHQVSRGTLSRDTWIWTSEAIRDGQTVRQKMTMKVVSRRNYTLKFEISTKRNTLKRDSWLTFMQGKATRRSK